MSLGPSSPIKTLLGLAGSKALWLLSLLCWEQGDGGEKLCRERLAAPSARGPRSACVDISQDALSADDISETGLQMQG